LETFLAFSLLLGAPWINTSPSLSAFKLELRTDSPALKQIHIEELVQLHDKFNGGL